MDNTRNVAGGASGPGRKPEGKDAIISGITCKETTKERFEIYCSQMKMSRGDALEFLLNLMEGEIKPHVREWIDKAKVHIYFCDKKKQFIKIKPFIKNGSEGNSDMHVCPHCGEKVMRKGDVERETETLKHIDGMPIGAND